MNASKLVASIELFDTYRGKGIPSKTKSLALHLEFRDPNKTLEAETVDQEVKTILKSLEGKKVKLRQVI